MDRIIASSARTLTNADTKKNIPFTVQVPDGTTQLNIRLAFSPWVVDGFKNLLTLTVFDPNGFRGAGHRHGDAHGVAINAAYASPGYIAGPIQPGEWTVVIDTHLIMPGPPCDIRLDVTASDEPTSSALQPFGGLRAGSETSILVTRHPVPLRFGDYSPSPVTRTWYRGDLHAHSIHSDASWDIPDLIDWARSQRLDFCTLSDHNTVSGLAQMDASRDGLLTMGGMELTTFWGHALALGVREWVDWRVREGERSIEQIAADVTARGATFVIAHPTEVGDPYCTGCRWVYESMRSGTARVVEVWNGPWRREANDNDDALALVYSWLNAGQHLALTAGTDNHGRESHSRPYGFNVVYSDELSEEKILRAIRAGHSYLSSGPHLELNALADSWEVMMGDVLTVSRDVPLQLTAQWNDCPPDTKLDLIVDGASKAGLTVEASGTQQWELKGGDARWCLVTLRERDGTMLALTNPIYFKNAGKAEP